MEKLKLLPAVGPRLPLDLDRIPSLESSEAKATKKYENEFEAMVQRLSQLGQEKRDRKATRKKDSSDVIVKPNKER